MPDNLQGIKGNPFNRKCSHPRKGQQSEADGLRELPDCLLAPQDKDKGIHHQEGDGFLHPSAIDHSSRSQFIFHYTTWKRIV